ncbi:MAG TPA: hypothetical protein VFN52_04320 [Acidiferrobacteraceae bacterium]|nr:hypothetical protein [Acidiferrobacteraceae bacterium]
MKTKGILAAATLVALAATPAFAASGSMNDMSGMSGMSNNTKCTHSKTVHGVMGVHTMGGTVTAINHRTGMLSLKTGMGVLRLHFPPKALAHVKDGEHLVAHLGFTVGH